MSIKIPVSVMKNIVMTRINNGEGKSYDQDFIDGKISLSEWQEFEKNKVATVRKEEAEKKEQEVEEKMESAKVVLEDLKEKGVIETDKNTAEILLFGGLGVVALIALITYIKNR